MASKKSGNTLDTAAGNEQLLRAEVGELTNLLREAKAAELEMVQALADEILLLREVVAEKERKLVSAFGFVRKYRKMLEEAGLLEKPSRPVDAVLEARRAAMAAAKAEAMATGQSVKVA